LQYALPPTSQPKGCSRADTDIRITNRHAFAAELMKTEAVVGIVVDADQKFRGLARLDEVANERFIATAATGIGRKLDAGSRGVTDSRHDRATGDLQRSQRCSGADADSSRHPDVAETRISPAGSAADVERTWRKHAGRVHAKNRLRKIEILVQAQPGTVVPAQCRLGGKHSPGLRRNFLQRNVSRDLQLCRRRCGADADRIVAVKGYDTTAAAQEKNPAADIADL